MLRIVSRTARVITVVRPREIQGFWVIPAIRYPTKDRATAVNA